MLYVQIEHNYVQKKVWCKPHFKTFRYIVLSFYVVFIKKKSFSANQDYIFTIISNIEFLTVGAELNHYWVSLQSIGDTTTHRFISERFASCCSFCVLFFSRVSWFVESTILIMTWEFIQIHNISVKTLFLNVSRRLVIYKIILKIQNKFKMLLKKSSFSIKYPVLHIVPDRVWCKIIRKTENFFRPP